jgi:phage terminase large subunit
MAQLNPNLKDFWFNGDPCESNFIKARHRVLYGGRASSKSWEFAGMAAFLSQKYRTRFLCVRRFQNKIKESVYSLIKAQIENFGFTGFDIQVANIYHQNGSDFSFYGIERNVDEIKSFEGADVLWLEEAHNLTKEQWDILEPTIRKQGSEIWISFNPKLMTDFVYKRFILNPPPSTRVRLINYKENPFISQTMLDAIEAKRLEDQDEYEHIYLGVPKTNDDAAIIKRSWIEAAIDAHKVLGLDMFGSRTVGYDVADSGEDKNAAAIFNGLVATMIDEWKAGDDELEQSAMRAWRHVEGGLLVYDSIGVGAHVGSTLKKHGHHSFSKFNAAGVVVKPELFYAPAIRNKEKFENLKAQAWQDVADRLRNTYNAVRKGMEFPVDQLISISSDIEHLERLKDELSLPHKSTSNRGLDMVEKKDEIKKRGFMSPNLADAFIMGAVPHLVGKPKPLGRITFA